jgi:hypothetical protein
MSTEPNITPDQLVSVMFQSIKLLGNAFWQLYGRFEALKQTICELHPEVKKTLEDRIQTAQNESLQEFASLQRMLELLGSMPKGPVQ